ncbi:hypothetical protein JZ751_027981 [Albula glossodonta]|uniref:Epithelial-stromal interaction protein 1 n=1 Tax=Albula glossodonta TaxID=121402 RepID=A0A8T2PCR2_9TELE|nr:hypothetical protein JZ751_027981 [Albula glossodonta]
MIPPNESRRSKLQRMAQKEEQDLQRWREENKPGPIHLPPSPIGGTMSLEEARQRQIIQSRQSKLQKKLKQEEMERRRRDAEEEENQRMKAIQREKANKLQERRKQEEQERREQFKKDYQERTQHFLQRIEKSNSAPTAMSCSLPTSSWARGWEYREASRAKENALLVQKKEEQRMKSELLEEKQKKLEEEREREMFIEHRRVNSAFLDRLQGGARGFQGVETSCVTTEDDRDWQTTEAHIIDTSPGPELAQGQADSAEEDDDDPSWVVMKLINNFPFYEREFLEEIVDQCNGNYEQAYSLLQHD